jgi:RES domain-containing protein
VLRNPKDPTGAFRHGGRWNSEGKAVLYSAGSLSLACLELLVHIRDTGNMPDLVYSEIELPDPLIDWWSQDAIRTDAILDSDTLSREMGDNWLERQAFKEEIYPVSLRKRLDPRAVLQVPSSVIREEWNYLLNPADPAYSAITWSEPKRFRLDPRLIDTHLR